MKNFILNSNFFDQSVVKLPSQKIEANLLSGSNQKNILIVCVERTGHKNVDGSFLEKILASVNIDLQKDATLFSINQDQAFSWKAVGEAVEFERLIFFGSSLKQLGLQISGQPFTPFNYQEKTILIADYLDALNSEGVAQTQKKRALWNALKVIFND